VHSKEKRGRRERDRKERREDEEEDIEEKRGGRDTEKRGKMIGRKRKGEKGKYVELIKHVRSSRNVS
jgi:hypothetical protein